MVVLDVVIAKDGTVKSVSPTSGDPALTASAMDAVKQRRYQPTLVNGQAVEVETTVSVNYSIKDSPSATPSGGDLESPGLLSYSHDCHRAELEFESERKREWNRERRQFGEHQASALHVG